MFRFNAKIYNSDSGITFDFIIKVNRKEIDRDHIIEDFHRYAWYVALDKATQLVSRNELLKEVKLIDYINDIEGGV